MTAIERPPIEPLEPAFTFHVSLDRAARPPEAGDARHPRDASACSSSPRRRWTCSPSTACASTATAQIAKFPPEIVLAAMAKAPRRFAPGRPRRELRHPRRRRQHLLHDRRLRRRDHRFRDARTAPVHQGRRGRRDAHAGLPLEHRLLVADGQRRRLRRDVAAARARRRLEQHGQAPAGDGAGRARSPLRRRDGDGDRRRRRGAAPPARAERPHRHHLAARHRQGRHRGGARVRRGRRAGRAS